MVSVFFPFLHEQEMAFMKESHGGNENDGPARYPHGVGMGRDDLFFPYDFYGALQGPLAATNV
jgi:hypothetical protein